MSGKVSDLLIRSKRALFRQKKLDRIKFKSGKRGRVLRNPPGVTTGQWVSGVVGKEARRTAPKDSPPQFRVRVWLGLG